ncbi:MAG: starch-binding protein, partial [Clostridia bacterium]|nr:starch-binding protein [Clostridia bacterium]
MKRSKRILSLLLCVLLVVSMVATASVFNTSAAGTLSSYFKTNPSGQVGANKTISIDGSLSDWDSSMLIAQGTANDDPRVYRPNSMYEVGVDLYALYGAYDDNNVYLMWEMTNVQDVVAPNDNYPLSQGVLWQTQEFPFFIMVDTGKADTAIGNNGALQGGGHIWGSGMTVQNSFNKLIAINTKGGNGPWVYGGDSTGLNPVELLTASTSKVDMGYGLGILSKNVYGIDKAYGEYNGRVPGDVCDESSAWVDFNTLGHSSSTMDFFYEMSIPYSELGITKADVVNNGIGVMVVATMGMSPMDCLHGDPVMTDQADLDDAANSQENNSFEKSDEDFITAPFARIGKAGGGTITPPVDQPTDPATQPTTTQAVTTAAPAQAPTTVAPTQAPTTAEPTEAPTTVEPTEKPTEPIIIPPTPTTTVEPTEVPTTTQVAPTIQVPTMDFNTTAPTEEVTTAKPSVPVIVPDKGILGDADDDEKVNIKDATLIQKHLAKITTLSEDAQFLSDVDANEILNIRDVTFIQKWIAKIKVDFAIGEPVAGEEIVIPVPTTVAKPTEEPTVIIVPTTTADEPTEAPTTAAPTQAPTTAAPTEAPTTVTPTEAPTTVTPTEAPTTAAPIVTEPPVVTEPPIITEPPVYTEPPVDPPVSDTVTIYFENTYGWSSVYWHAWNDAGGTNTPWPGDPMTNVSGNIYSAEVSTEFTGIIFNDGSGSDSAKTDNADIAGDGQMYSNGSWVAYDPNGGGNDNPNPPVPSGSTIYVRDSAGWGTVYCHS